MNTRIDYLYRDASNYKEYAHLVCKGEPTQALVDRLLSACPGNYGPVEPNSRGSWTWMASWSVIDVNFIADQVDFEECFFGGVYEDDGCYHELSEIRATSSPADDGRTFEEVVEAFEAANKKGWREFDLVERKTGRLSPDRLEGVEKLLREVAAAGLPGLSDKAQAWLDSQ